ncbi:MAG: hypothetical protein Q8M83_01740 [bacterium]|nr:hypothetical protein [bacterium]
MSEQMNIQEENPYKENSIVDYLGVILRRKVSIIAVFIIIFVVGMVLASLLKTEDVFSYNTVLKIGAGTPAIIQSEMQEIIIPLAAKDFAAQNQQKHYKIDAVLVDGNIMIFKSQGTLDKTEDILKVQQMAADLLIKEQEKTNEATKMALQRDLTRAENIKKGLESELASLKEQVKFFPAQQKRIDNANDLIKKQIIETRGFITVAQNNRSTILVSEAGRSANEESLATALLMIDSEIQRYQTELVSLEKKISIEFQEGREKIEKDIFNNKQAQTSKQIAINEAQQVINEARFKMDNFKKTEVVIPPARQPEPVKRIDLLAIAFIMAIVALMSGIFWAFLAELVKKTRQLRES